MSESDRQRAMDFWFEFDNTFMWKITDPRIKKIYSNLGFSHGLETQTFNRFAATVHRPGFPRTFIRLVRPHESDFSYLFRRQCVILQKYFRGSAEAQQSAFELFGQGVLFDKRRATPAYDYWSVHAMDADYASKQWPIGYHSWYGFLRAHTLLSGTSGMRCDWRTLATHIALGAAVQQAMRPAHIEAKVKRDPKNPPISRRKLNEFRRTYLPMDFDELDVAFTQDQRLGPPPRTSRFA